VTAARKIRAGKVIQSGDLAYVLSTGSSTGSFDDKWQLIGK
jgi:hypothetical protein